MTEWNSLYNTFQTLSLSLSLSLFSFSFCSSLHKKIHIFFPTCCVDIKYLPFISVFSQWVLVLGFSLGHRNCWATPISQHGVKRQSHSIGFHNVFPSRHFFFIFLHHFQIYVINSFVSLLSTFSL